MTFTEKRKEIENKMTEATEMMTKMKKLMALDKETLEITGWFRDDHDFTNLTDEIEDEFHEFMDRKLSK